MSFEPRPGADIIDDGVLYTEADVRVAQALVDAWAPPVCQGGEESYDIHVAVCVPLAQALLELRGLLVRTVAEVRAAGVLEGHRAGWREALDTAEAAVREALGDLPR